MIFDIIITTYNRPDSLKVLVEQILESSILPEHIIVVDSSKEEDNNIQKLESIKYIRSSHGNQPYQRYVGYLASEADALIFFDDDMRIKDDNAFEKILAMYEDTKVVGVQTNFKNINDFLNEQVPKSKIADISKKNVIGKYIKSLSGYHIPNKGQLSYCGTRGTKPENLKKMHYFNGGVFSCRRLSMFNNFNFKLFDLFEYKVGMGEDAIIGYNLSKEGDILYLAECMFLHDDQKDSTYAVDFKSYGKRVAYSRLYLSYEYVRLSGKSKLIALLHFNWYMLWRIVGMGINQLINYKIERTQLLFGSLQGYFTAIRDARKLAMFDNGNYWNEEALYDIGR